MEILDHTFTERLAEIETYLDLLAALEEQTRTGPPRIGTEGPVVSTTQQRILYSSVYLQLYNLVEATITKCVEALCSTISANKWLPSDLSTELRGEWVRYLARTHVDLSYDNRLKYSLVMCEHLINTIPVGFIEIEKGGGGNWDDEAIYRFSSRLGCELSISNESNKAVKQPFRDSRGALGIIVKFRNDLAHGTLSFSECGTDVDVAALRDLKSRAAMYLTEVVESFKTFIETYSFLQPQSRPSKVAA
ncbi:MAG: MAE_28990/MAE_18760 family HEPN-like nuclease [Trueperaceae bacterium]